MSIEIETSPTFMQAVLAEMRELKNQIQHLTGLLAGNIASQDETRLLTFKEAMAYLRTSRSTVYRLMWSGQLTGEKIGVEWRFTRAALDKCKRNVIPVAPASSQYCMAG